MKIGAMILKLTAGALVAFGMLTAAYAQTMPKKLNVAILIYDDVQIIDYAGPWEVFGPGNNVYTVAKTKDPISTIYNMKVVPDYSYSDHPVPDILVIPGGGGMRSRALGGSDPHLPTADTEELMNWIKLNAEKSQYVLSVCNGALLLAKAGLLDGLTATTTFGMYDALRQMAPKTKVVEDRRFVDNGKIITSAGLSSGIDASLHLDEKIKGRGFAQFHALGLEYNWDPEGAWARGALADKYMRFSYDGLDVVQSLGRQGDITKWENRWSLDATKKTDKAILDIVNKTVENNVTYMPSTVKWNLVKKTDKGSTWSFVDEKGNPWTGIVELAKSNDDAKLFILRVAVERNSKS